MKKILALLACSLGLSLFASDNLVGEYVGTIKADKGNFRSNPQIAFLVFKEGDTYKVRIYQDLWKRAVPYESFELKAENGALKFENKGHYKWTAEISNNKVVGKLTDKDKEVPFDVKFSVDKLERKSPTLGMPAPKNAVVLFDGKNLDEWRAANNMEMPWKIIKEGKDVCFEVAKKEVIENKNGKEEKHMRGSDIVSKKKFKNFKLHIEFMIPDEMNKTLGQHRANSGVFMGRFEVQILDSFGADGLWNECGALYKVLPPQINASLPPNQWQTYDIKYEAPKYKNGKMIEFPEISVSHNGMQIHKEIKLTEGTEHEGRNRDISRMGDGPVEIKLQDHGNPIRFRNIWVVEDDKD